MNTTFISLFFWGQFKTNFSLLFTLYITRLFVLVYAFFWITIIIMLKASCVISNMATIVWNGTRQRRWSHIANIKILTLIFKFTFATSKWFFAFNADIVRNYSKHFTSSERLVTCFSYKWYFILQLLSYFKIIWLVQLSPLWSTLPSFPYTEKCC